MEGFEPRRVGALQAYLRQAVLNRLRDELRRQKRSPDQTGVDVWFLNEGSARVLQHGYVLTASGFQFLG